MNASEPAPFTFAVLDGLGFAAIRDRLRPIPDGAYRFDALGPVLELACLSTSGVLPPPSRAAWLTLDDAAGLGSALGEGRTIWTCRERHLGFLRMRAVRPEDETEENAFKLEVQRAAHAVGFPRKLAAQLVGLDPTVVSPAAKSTSGAEAHQRQSPSKRLPATRV